MVFVLFVIGLVFLVVGAEGLVRGASRLAALIGISPLVIGLTVVAFGTSTPEMAVSVQSALTGQAGADIAVGNVVGSNIFNVLFILGLAAIITPLIVSQQLVRLDVPIMIGVSVLFMLFGWDGHFDRWEGFVLFAGIIAYTILAIYLGQTGEEAAAEFENEFGPKPSGPKDILFNIFQIIVGLVLLIVGSQWLVNGAIEIATRLGVSQLVISLTIVAIGTSLPEVATSIVASLRGERDIAVGNVVGSNIFNILAVMGLATIVSPGGVNVSAAAIHFDIPVMLAVAIACLPIFFTGYTIVRLEGALFFGYYLVYTAYLILAATHHDALPLLSTVMLFFVVPLTVITLAGTAVRQLILKPA